MLDYKHGYNFSSSSKLKKKQLKEALKKAEQFYAKAKKSDNCSVEEEDLSDEMQVEKEEVAPSPVPKKRGRKKKSEIAKKEKEEREKSKKRKSKSLTKETEEANEDDEEDVSSSFEIYTPKPTASRSKRLADNFESPKTTTTMSNKKKPAKRLKTDSPVELNSSESSESPTTGKKAKKRTKKEEKEKVPEEQKTGSDVITTNFKVLITGLKKAISESQSKKILSYLKDLHEFDINISLLTGVKTF